MRIETTLAVCAALVAAGKLLDDFYLSDAKKADLVMRIGACLRVISDVRIPRAATALARWFFSAERSSVLLSVMLGFLESAIFFLISAWDDKSEYKSKSLSILLFLSVFNSFAIFMFYIIARRIFHFFDKLTLVALRMFAIPACIIYLFCISLVAILLYKSTTTYLSHGNVGDQIGAILIGITIIMFAIASLCVPCLFFCFILFVFICRILIITSNVIFQHLLDRAHLSKKPFGYLAAVISLILALCKAAEEVLKT